MVRIALQIKANLENITNLKPEGDDFRWYLMLKCLNCGQESKGFVYIDLLESVALKGGRGSASLVSKCKLCSRENSIDIISDSISSIQWILWIGSPRVGLADDNKFKTIVVFECRGLEPTDFSPRGGWMADGVDSPSKFEVDLKEKEWCDYDENAQVSVGVYELEHQFIKL